MKRKFHTVTVMTKDGREVQGFDNTKLGRERAVRFLKLAMDQQDWEIVDTTMAWTLHQLRAERSAQHAQ